jgi:hypothetical protein
MAHFAKIGNDNIVERVEVVHNNIATDEQAGITFLQNLYNDTATWKQTSYNTFANTHKLSGTAFRKNYASVGYTYDETKDAFIAPKPYASWVLNDDTCRWEAPVAYPDDGERHTWNEDTTSWDAV